MKPGNALVTGQFQIGPGVVVVARSAVARAQTFQRHAEAPGRDILSREFVQQRTVAARSSERFACDGTTVKVAHRRDEQRSRIGPPRRVEHQHVRLSDEIVKPCAPKLLQPEFPVPIRSLPFSRPTSPPSFVRRRDRRRRTRPRPARLRPRNTGPASTCPSRLSRS